MNIPPQQMQRLPILLLLLASNTLGCHPADDKPSAQAPTRADQAANEEQRYQAARVAAVNEVPSPSDYGSHLLVPVNFGMSRAKVQARLIKWEQFDPTNNNSFNLDGHHLRTEYILQFENDQLVRCGLKLLLDTLTVKEPIARNLYEYLRRDIGSGYAYNWQHQRQQMGPRIMAEGYAHGDTAHAARSWFWGATEIEVQRLPGVGYQILYRNLANRRPTPAEILADSLELRRAAEIF